MQYPSNEDFFTDLHVAEPHAIYRATYHKLIWRENGNYVFHANSLQLMDAIAAKHPNGCFDMIFADPPYFLSNGGITCKNGEMVSVDKGGWDKSQGLEEDYAFHLQWLEKCQRLLKPDGTIWVSGTLHAIYSIGFAMQKLGYKMLNDIIWEKPNPPPHLACRYFTHSTEILLWAAKTKRSKYCFNYADMKQINAGKQMKNIWRIATPSKSEKIHGKHPTQKPVALIERCIAASTQAGDFVFDPFAGSGTTGIAAIRTARQFCVCEIENEYASLAVNRLSDFAHSSRI